MTIVQATTASSATTPKAGPDAIVPPYFDMLRIPSQGLLSAE
jgi:hypothetical protein